MAKVLCACGCGEIIDDQDRKGRLRRYVQYHASGHIPRQPWRKRRYIDSLGYVMILVGKEHHLAEHNGYAKEHRLVMEVFLSRKLTANEVIHHKNGDRSDNRPDNLELYGASGPHARDHLRKLSDSDVVSIRASYAWGRVSQDFLAERYGISHSTIGRVVRRETYAHLD